MAEINLTSNLTQVLRSIKHTRDQIPFAIASGLTAVAKAAQAEVGKSIATTFVKTGKPTPFTLNATGIVPAKKNADVIQAQVFIKPQQAKYLGIQVTGGERVPTKGKALTIPVNIARNASGKLGRNAGAKIERLLKDKSYFIGEVKGVNGLWHRTGKGRSTKLVLMVLFTKKGEVKPVFPFEALVNKVVQVVATPLLTAALEKAMATAK